MSGRIWLLNKTNDIQDPLSALDANVGESVFNNVLLGRTSDTTRILVTHALHFLPKVDYIYFMVDGRIAERGTFEEMMANRGEFSRTFDEFVTKGQRESEGEKAMDFEDEGVDENAEKRRAAGRGAALMQAEERNTGAVGLQVYKRYFQSGNLVLLPAWFVAIVLMQALYVLSLYWYVLPRLLSITPDINECLTGLSGGKIGAYSVCKSRPN